MIQAWTNSQLDGPATTRQILEWRHMKRAINAHITTLQVLFDLYIEAFVVENDSLKICTKRASLNIARACNNISEAKAILYSHSSKNTTKHMKIHLCLNGHVCTWKW